MDAFTGFEPQVGEIRALRTFRIGPGGLLYPLFSDTAWRDGPNTARCKLTPGARTHDADSDEPHVAPQPDCSCGYYAYASEANAGEFPRSRHVLAVIACWGRVIAGTRGIRAEHARVEALWVSDSVPEELLAGVAERYPSISLYTDRAAMLAEHPPTRLDCYEPATRTQTRLSLGLRLATLTALGVGALPASWIWQHHDARLLWAAQLTFFVLTALVLRLTRHDIRSRGSAIFCAAIALWLAAPFAGPAGTFLLRMPMLQIAFLGVIQRAHIKREAGRFPARIGHSFG